MTSEQIETAAKMLAGAYWRGRFESLRVTDDTNIYDAMVNGAVKQDLSRWEDSAKALLRMLYPPIRPGYRTELSQEQIDAMKAELPCTSSSPQSSTP